VNSGTTTVGGGTIAGVPQPTYTTPGVTTMVPIDRHLIESVLHVGTYERRLESEDENSGTWRAAAKRAVQDVTAWVEANRERLPQR